MSQLILYTVEVSFVEVSFVEVSFVLQANEMSESQKRQFRVTVEELKAKLQESMVNRDSVLDLR